MRRIEGMTECHGRAPAAVRPGRLPGAGAARIAARAAVLVAIALMLAACGDDGEETAGGAAPDGIAVSLDGAPAAGAEPALGPPVAPVPEPAEEPSEPAAPDPDPPAEAAAAPDPDPSAAEAEAQLAAFAADEPVLPPEMAALLADADADAGRSYAQRCTGCHSFQAGRPARTEPQVGPSLFGIVDRRIGIVDDYDYSEALLALREAGAVWTVARLAAFLADPAAVVPGTSMTFAVRSDSDRANAIAFLMTLAPAPGQNPGAIGNPDLVDRIEAANPADGEALTERCTGCHTFGAGEENLVGPNLFATIGAPVGGVEGFGYSLALAALNEDDAIWTYERLDEFLESPAVAVPGTRMGFAGIADPEERAAIIAYLAVLSPRAALVEEGVTIGVAQPGLNPLTFSNTEVQFGAVWYALDGCDTCHGGNLRGRFDFLGNAVEERMPALIGAGFEENWFGRTVFDLLDFVAKHRTGIDDAHYPQIVGYILVRNGFLPGATPLPTDRAAQEAMGFFQ